MFRRSLISICRSSTRRKPPFSICKQCFHAVTDTDSDTDTHSNSNQDAALALMTTRRDPDLFSTPLEQYQSLMEATVPWSSLEWNQARDLMRYDETDQHHLFSDNDSIAWQLMYRTVQEQEQARSSKETHSCAAAADVFTILIYSWSSTWTQSVLSARQVMANLESYRAILPDFSPPIHVYTTIIDTAIQNAEPQAYEFVEQVIQSLILHNNPRPNTALFAVAINALNKYGVTDAPQRAEAWIQQMKDLGITPNELIYNTIITIWAYSRQPGAAQRAEQLLMESPNADTLTFSAVLTAWIKSNDPKAADRCYQILQHMKSLTTSSTSSTGVGGNKKVKPTARLSYGPVIAAYAKAGRPREAHAVMNELLQDYNKHKDPDLLPNRILFTILIQAWAKSGEMGAGQYAERLLEQMYSLAKETNNTISYLSPNTISFNAVLTAWTNSASDPTMSTHVAKRADEILQRMLHLDQQGILNVKPNELTYNKVLDCLAKSRSRDAAIRAEEILQDRINRYKAGADTEVKPSTISFNTVISAFAKSREKDAAVKGEEIYAKMKSLGVEPSKRTFSALISAWANSRDPRAANKAEDLLNEIKEMHVRGQNFYKPNTILYNSVIHAWSTSNDPSATARAQALVDELIAAGHTDCRPNVITYNALLNVVAKSKVQDKAVVARNIISQMVRQSIPPDSRSYDAVIMTCAFSNNYDRPTREIAFQIAVEMFHKVNSEMTPSRELFSFFFKAAAHLEKDIMVESVYKICCEAGFENNELIQRDLKIAAPHLAKKSD